MHFVWYYLWLDYSRWFHTILTNTFMKNLRLLFYFQLKGLGFNKKLYMLYIRTQRSHRGGWYSGTRSLVISTSEKSKILLCVSFFGNDTIGVHDKIVMNTICACTIAQGHLARDNLHGTTFIYNQSNWILGCRGRVSFLLQPSTFKVLRG